MATATATIDLNAIRQNWQKLRRLSSGDTAAVVKANAYGLGIKQVASALYSDCLLYTSPSPRDLAVSRMPSSA